MKEYKAANLEAFQTEVGLDVNPDAKLYFATGRLTTQKGYGLITNVMERFLKEPGNEKAQVVLVTGPVSSIEHDDIQAQNFMDKWADSVIVRGEDTPQEVTMIEKNKHDLAGRLAVLPIFDVDLVKRGMAAASVNWMQSLFEPFGIVQGQARAHGTPSILPWGDGPRTNVNNPNQSINIAEHSNLPMIPSGLTMESATNHGQNGWFFNPTQLDMDKVRGDEDGYDHMRAGLIDNLPEAEEATLATLNAVHSEIKDDPAHLAKLQLDSLNYALEQDTWDTAAETYMPPAMLSILGNTSKGFMNDIDSSTREAMQFYTNHAKGAFENRTSDRAGDSGST